MEYPPQKGEGGILELQEWFFLLTFFGYYSLLLNRLLLMDLDTLICIGVRLG